MKLTVLGCGDAFASGGGANTCFLLEGSRTVLMECGATALLRLKQAGFDPSAIGTIVISHFHGDHFGGLPFLILNWTFQEPPKTRVQIIGPPGVRERTFDLQEALYPGTGSRLDALGIEFLEFAEGGPVVVEGVTTTTVAVVHSEPALPHGYRIEMDGKSVAYSGDTEWTDALVGLADGADLFICECNDHTASTPGHLSYRTILEKREVLNCRRLVLTHFGPEMVTARDLEIERLKEGMVLAV